jgi:hypothetical protein
MAAVRHRDAVDVSSMLMPRVLGMKAGEKPVCCRYLMGSR